MSFVKLTNQPVTQAQGRAILTAWASDVRKGWAGEIREYHNPNLPGTVFLRAIASSEGYEGLATSSASVCCLAGTP